MDARNIMAAAEARHRGFMDELHASMPTFDVPVGDSDYTAPGWLWYGSHYFTFPDVAYPWDPAVVAAIREFCPSLIPLTVRDVYRWSGHNELGHLGDPLVLTRHVIARHDDNLYLPPHEFECAMPVVDSPLTPAAPNYIECVWHDRDNKELSPDLPGAFLPHDWELYHSTREYYRDQDAGHVQSRGFVGPWKERQERRRAANAPHEPGCACNSCYVDSKVKADIREAEARASDSEITAELLGDYEAPAPAPMTSVSSTSTSAGKEL